MLGYLKDKWRAATLQARYRRIVQEQVLDLIEGEQPLREETDRWMLLGDQKSGPSEQTRNDVRSAARHLSQTNPYARNILRLLGVYVVGPGLKLSVVPKKNQTDKSSELLNIADNLWQRFLDNNRRHFSFREFARRTWRDGECFLRLYAQPGELSAVRFLDPEQIGPTRDQPDSQGIITAPGDAETPILYLKLDPATGELVEEIDADDMLHTRIGVDSNQKRGISIFASNIEMLTCFDRWLEIELTARKLQASIVLWRKVQGSAAQAQNLAEGLATGAVSADAPAGNTISKERFGPGSIITTSAGTEMKFLQPNTNFGDAVPLGRMLLLSIAAGAGLPEFMLTSDASNANFASTMVAEGPAVKLFQSEQVFFTGELLRLWQWVMEQAIRDGLLPDDFFESVTAEWTFPELVNRDRPREREADVKLVEARVLSKSEVARRDKADPKQMQREIAEEGLDFDAKTQSDKETQRET